MEATPPVMETAPETPVATTSLFARIFNVFATPSEVFDEVKASKPSTANWLVPTLLGLVVGIVWVFVVFSQPAITAQIREQTAKSLEPQVQAGKLTQAQVDQYSEMGVTMGKFIWAVFAAAMAFIRPFWWALVLWLSGKWFLKANFSYGKALEVAGLTTIIGVLGLIVMTLVDIYVGQIVNVSLALFVLNDDPKNLLRVGLALVDVFDLWLTAIMAVGLSRLAGVSWSKALVPTFCYWLVIAAILFGLGLLGAHSGAGAKPH